MDKLKVIGAFMVNFTDIEEPSWYSMVRLFIWFVIGVGLFPSFTIGIIKWLTFCFNVLQ